MNKQPLWEYWPRLRSSALSLPFGEQADGEELFSSSGERGGSVLIPWASEGGRKEREQHHVAFISYHITVALSCLSVSCCLPSCDFPTIYPFTPTGFCSITLSFPLLHLAYLFHFISSRLAASPELISPCCVQLSAWGALITPS